MRLTFEQVRKTFRLVWMTFKVQKSLTVTHTILKVMRTIFETHKHELESCVYHFESRARQFKSHAKYQVNLRQAKTVIKKNWSKGVYAVSVAVLFDPLLGKVKYSNKSEACMSYFLNNRWDFFLI